MPWSTLRSKTSTATVVCGGVIIFIFVEIVARLLGVR